MKIFATILMTTCLAACTSEPSSGPGEITWNRDSCDRCRMSIGDRRYAVQAREAAGERLHRFDDLGCALLWLDDRKLPGTSEDPRPEIWVRALPAESWVDAHQVRFVDGLKTPMGYGIGGAAEASSESFDLAEAWERIREREGERRSARR